MKETVKQAFRRQFDREPSVLTRAPGRLEILGNHTDYNEGVVLSVAVDRATFVAAGRAAGTTCRVVDIENDTSRAFDTGTLGQREEGDWANYIKGLLVELAARDIAVPAFDAVLASTVPMSAGMSSSAALEMSMVYALIELAGADLDWAERARVGQGAENNYVGAMTGLLDQFSSIKGKAGHLVFSDFRSYDVSNVPLPVGTALVVANSRVKHTLTNEYNERRQMCERAVADLQTRYPNISALRDVSMSQLEAARDAVDPTAYRRALHVVGENERVMAGVEALRDGDLEAFGRLMFASHESSRVNFENSCAELDALVEAAKTLPGAIGARLSGGGFGGITVHLVHADAATSYAAGLEDRYCRDTGIEADVMICQAADGAEILA